ncbi:SsgA family sporulation/cell division regulator [Kitasatospora sp. NBC_00315]|uniref:SsgA family sporulation/cell division regulator n=1 Tax=Kitasatospora sp. NBC_00315 TaxID=2975963 RepID=UPI003248779E
MRTVVEHESTVHLTGPAAGGMTMLMRYDSDDPYAVRLDFLDAATPEDRTSQDGCVTWAVGRELLTVGLDRPCGTGDVFVRPGTAALTELAFSGVPGVAVLLVSTEALRTFLRATYTLVAAGSETARLTVPDDLSALFESSEEQHPG